jgi:beta-N-acetylhexosaminidase
VTGLLREQLGFGGVVISDDLGAARQVASWSPGERATQFIAAGGDLVLTVDGPFVAQMVSAVVDRAESDPGFRATVNASALRVLQLKNDRGLLGR